jgi:metal-sulfur cluster biosynthetic enzyme
MNDNERIRHALAGVEDPEIGHSIVALGLVDRIEVEPGQVHVTLIATSATCPMADVLVEQAADAVRRACPPNTEVDVEIDWEQAWTPERMDAALRRSFGW